MTLLDRVRAMFDLGADPLRISEHLRRDERLQKSVRSRPGMRVPGAWDGFELAIRAILGQQVSVTGATTMAGRLVTAFGEPLCGHGDDRLTHLFPRPAQLVEADLSTVGIIRSRAGAIRELSRRVCDGTLVIDASSELEETVEQLCGIPGIGPWTAQYVAMRALHEPDAFPATDLGLLQALANDGESMTSRALTKMAQAWRPWRAYAAMHLWRIRARKES